MYLVSFTYEGTSLALLQSHAEVIAHEIVSLLHGVSFKINTSNT